ncbi:MAG: glycosyltransferase [Ornithinimicrobium sp.]|uniref:glycosyltransferase n=1 Tax=Ornithinimicrobium sp. TaxID=1977084 RepID=UPI003D9AF59F
MRVLAVTTWLPTRSHPSTGAFVVKDARALADHGYDVALVHLVPPGQLDVGGTGVAEAATLDGIPVTRIPMSTTSPRQIRAAGTLLQAMTRRADLVHTMAFSTLPPMAWWRPEAPWVHTEHWSGLTAPQTLPRSWRVALPALRRLLSRPDVVTAVCDYLATPIRDVRGARPTTVVPCVVPRPQVQPRPELEGELTLVDVGALIPRKDPVLAVDVVAELTRRGRPTRIRLVGQGELADEVRGRARALGVGDRVDLLGSLDRAGVLAELAAADVFIGPTRGDNFFVSCAEALLGGRPVVVGATGGQGEYLDPRVGATVPTQSAIAYADAVERVLASAADLSAAQISQTIGDRFEAAVVARGYADAYDRAASLRRRPAGRRGRGSR